MNVLRKILFAPSACLVAIAVSHGAEKSQLPAFQGKIKGFTVPAKDYLLKGESAEALPNGNSLLEGITVETRRTNQLNFIVHTPSGEFRREEDLITSTNTLEVRSRDDRFFLSGVGYDFQPTTNRLVIHSNVVTRFDRLFFEDQKPVKTTAGRRTNSAPLQVTAGSFEFDGATGDADYRQSVHFTDGEMLEVAAGEIALNIAALTNETRRVLAREDVQLHVQLEDGIATAKAGEGIFSTAPGIDARVDLDGNPVWTNNLLSGSAARLHWQMTSNRYEFVGTGGASIRFPGSMFVTNQTSAAKTTAPNQQWIDIYSDSHRFVPGRLLFEEDVVARQDTNWMMSTRKFVVDLDATNHPIRMEATDDFIFEAKEGPQKGRGSAGHALVEYQPDGRPVVALTGEPHWVSLEFEKSADRITVVDPLGEPVYSGDGHVRLKLLGLRLADLDWFGSRTNEGNSNAADVAADSEPVLITADHSRYHAGLAEFSGNVVVASGTNFLTAPELSLSFSPERRLTNLVASGGVNVRQGRIVLAATSLVAESDGSDRNLPKIEAAGDVRICGGLEKGAGRGTGTSLHYDGETGDAVLEGNPELLLFKSEKPGSRKSNPPVLHKAPQIHWNLHNETFRLNSPFSIITLPADVEVPHACD